MIFNKCKLDVKSGGETNVNPVDSQSVNRKDYALIVKQMENFVMYMILML